MSVERMNVPRAEVLKLAREFYGEHIPRVCELLRLIGESDLFAETHDRSLAMICWVIYRTVLLQENDEKEAERVAALLPSRGSPSEALAQVLAGHLRDQNPNIVLDPKGLTEQALTLLAARLHTDGAAIAASALGEEGHNA